MKSIMQNANNEPCNAVRSDSAGLMAPHSRFRSGELEVIAPGQGRNQNQTFFPANSDRKNEKRIEPSAARRSTPGVIGRLAMVTVVLFGALASPSASAQTTTPTFSSWTHGVSVEVEDPSRIASVYRRGFGASLRTYGQTWVHFAIPTPVVASGTRLRLQRVRLLWGTDSVAFSSPPQPIGAKIWAVHVWDGDVKLAEFGEDKFHFIGQQYIPGVASQDLRTNPADIPGTPYVYWGVVVSILVDAPVGINLKAVGGDFVTLAPNPLTY